MFRFLLFFFLFYPVLLFSKIAIVTSIYPVKLIIDEIATKNFKVYSVIPVNSDPHLFEPTPSISRIIEKADIFIGVQKDFDGWIEKILNKNATAVYLNKSGINPHIWLSAEVILAKIEIIKNVLIKFSPEDKQVIIRKTKIFSNKLNNLISEFKNKFDKLKNKNIIEFHPAWDYLCHDLGLNLAGVLSTSEHNEVSLKKYITLLKIAKKKNVKIILMSRFVNSGLAKSFAKEIDAKIIYISPLGNNEKSYIEFLKNIYSEIYLNLLRIQNH